MHPSRRRVAPRRSLLLLPWLLLPLGCGGGDTTVDESMLGDLAFNITQDCGGGDGTTCEPVCEDTYCEVCEDSEPPASGGCFVTGIGYLTDADGRDNFGGNGMPMKAGNIRGEWEHDDHGTGDKFHGNVGYLVCRHVDEPGPGQPSGPDHNFTINQAYYGGPGRWFEPGTGWQDGYWFDVMAEDHGEPGKTDEYYFSVRKLDASGQVGGVIYETGGILSGGNFQIHPPNDGHPFTGGTLPQWVPLQP
ncbi:MAG: hypothetical protein H6Q90_1309 [Deltaproteobacteria bacterium]|nr:hypothetical protein [Deltaproteobacteria bacterium]